MADLKPEALILRRMFPQPVTFADLRRAALIDWAPFWAQPFAALVHRKAEAVPVIREWWHAAIKEATGALDVVYALVRGREFRVATTLDGRQLHLTGATNALGLGVAAIDALLDTANEADYWQRPHEVRLNLASPTKIWWHDPRTYRDLLRLEVHAPRAHRRLNELKADAGRYMEGVRR